ncbi:MAG: hypothetical protein V3T31_12435, partial [candidate division Zixibacteria bacterium]
MNIYLSVYLGSLLLALMMTPAVIWTARRLNIVDVPGARHMHTRPVSHVGGLSIFLSTMTLSIAVLWFSKFAGTAGEPMLGQLHILLLAAGFMF